MFLTFPLIWQFFNPNFVQCQSLFRPLSCDEQNKKTNFEIRDGSKSSTCFLHKSLSFFKVRFYNHPTDSLRLFKRVEFKDLKYTDSAIQGSHVKPNNWIICTWNTAEKSNRFCNHSWPSITHQTLKFIWSHQCWARKIERRKILTCNEERKVGKVWSKSVETVFSVYASERSMKLRFMQVIKWVEKGSWDMQKKNKRENWVKMKVLRRISPLYVNLRYQRINVRKKNLNKLASLSWGKKKKMENYEFLCYSLMSYHHPFSLEMNCFSLYVCFQVHCWLWLWL